MSHSTHQVNNLVSAILSPASLPLWLLPLWWSVAIIPENHVAGLAYRWCPSHSTPEKSCMGWGLLVCQTKGVFVTLRFKTFESFCSNWCISHGGRLSNYFFINILLCDMTVTLLWKCSKLIVTQHELLRYYGNAIYSVLHNRKCYVTMEMQYGA
jgi:hypothetical protein